MTGTNQRRFGLLIVIVAISGMAAMSVVFASLSKVTVYNQAQVPLTQVKIELAGTVVWEGNLLPGKKSTGRGRAKKDGVAAIGFIADGRRVYREFGYVTPGQRSNHIFVVLPDFNVQYVEK